MFADYTGVDIKQGDHLAVIYSPQLFAAQVEYTEARRALNDSAGLPAVRQSQQSLVTNTKKRLREFGMTDDQLTELEKSGDPQSRLTIYSPQGGTVVEKLAIEGNYVKAGDPIYRIADLSTIWLLLKLFPEDASRIRFGQRVDPKFLALTKHKKCGAPPVTRSQVDVLALGQCLHAIAEVREWVIGPSLAGVLKGRVHQRHGQFLLAH